MYSMVKAHQILEVKHSWNLDRRLGKEDFIEEGHSKPPLLLELPGPSWYLAGDWRDLPGDRGRPG